MLTEVTWKLMCCSDSTHPLRGEREKCTRQLLKCDLHVNAVTDVLSELLSQILNEFLDEFLIQVLDSALNESLPTCFHSVADKMKEAAAITPTANSMKSSVTLWNL